MRNYSILNRNVSRRETLNLFQKCELYYVLKKGALIQQNNLYYYIKLTRIMIIMVCADKIDH